MEILFTLFIIWVVWLIWKAFTNQKTAESRLLGIKKIISNGQYKALIIENYEDGIQNHEIARQIIQIEVRNLVDTKVLDKSYLEDEKFLNLIDASYVVAQVEVEQQIKLFKINLKHK